MSSRLTTPVSKFTRSISSTAWSSRPSNLLNNGTKSAASNNNGSRKRQTRKAVVVEEPSDYSTSAATPHRPTVPSRTIPLMQGFRTSAPSPSSSHAHTRVDFCKLPDLHTPPPSTDYMRVPLLPDNATPPTWSRAPEAVDAPLPKPEILVVAANPELVLPSALTEVEGMGVDGVELKFAHELDNSNTQNYQGVDVQGGMIRDLWKGLMDDVFGADQKGKKGEPVAA
ncbi:hypothetical protein B0H63DRAFT_230163 [Podospora didyma]|uniref:Uncharacterized protein n=1 Tax=Podospora didyma TaxID=330526 RepID=A0AAE0KJS5_9PEZI|nr:hypothetical protein B0H63DRAFT_230163 [Podospora didyma]